MTDLDLDALDALAAAANTRTCGVYLRNMDDRTLADAVPALTARVRETEEALSYLAAEREAWGAERDEARDEVARLRAQVDAVTALCDRADAPYAYPAVTTPTIRAALATGAES
jgi:hypothetical protein